MTAGNAGERSRGTGNVPGTLGNGHQDRCNSGEVAFPGRSPYLRNGTSVPQSPTPKGGAGNALEFDPRMPL